MARPLRVQYKGATFHIISRGNERTPIFFEDEDRQCFVGHLDKVVSRYKWRIYAFCLMNNHYHLLLRIEEENLSLGMRQLNGCYAQHLNKRYERAGHLFEGRFKAFLIERESYLLYAARYAVLNPVNVGLIDHPIDWPWSSYAKTAGFSNTPDFVETDGLLSVFSDCREAARIQYIYFVEEGVGKDSPLDEARGGWLLGNGAFSEDVQGVMNEDISEEIPQKEKFAAKPSLEEIFTDVCRDEGIYKATYQYGYRIKEVGDFLGIHPSVVSKASKRIAAIMSNQ